MYGTAVHMLLLHGTRTAPVGKVRAPAGMIVPARDDKDEQQKTRIYRSHNPRDSYSRQRTPLNWTRPRSCCPQPRSPPTVIVRWSSSVAALVALPATRLDSHPVHCNDVSLDICPFSDRSFK
jgi:hypothetical protein